MQKTIIYIFFLLFSFNSFSQQVLKDLSFYKSTTLPNGLTIITVKTQEYEYFNYRLFFDIHESTNKKYAGNLDVFCHLTGSDLIAQNTISKRLVSDSNAIDSVFNFLNSSLIKYTFLDENINKTKDYFIKKIEFEKNSRKELYQVEKRFSFGKNSSFAKYSTQSDIDLITKQSLEDLKAEIITPNNAFLVVVGNVEHEIIVWHATQKFFTWSGFNEIKEHENPSYTKESIISFLDKDIEPLTSISYPIDHFYTNESFFAKEINVKVFENKINETLPKYKFAKEIEFSMKPNAVKSEFLICFETHYGEAYDAIIGTIQIMRDMLIYNATATEINTAKSDLVHEFENSLKNPYNVAYYAFLTEKHELQNNYFQTYKSHINIVPVNEIVETTEQIFKPDNASILLYGRKSDLTCQLYYLAKFFRVEYFDKDFRKFKIINNGFDSYSIIADYLDACKANTELKNLTVKFEANYTADTTYKVEGIIYKKYPNYYYFRTDLILDKDTLLQKLQIANNEVWLDSSALGAEFSTEEKFWAKVYQAYIFPELYYPKLQYEPEFICDTTLLNDNIFKIKVSTPYNIYFYDYYDMNNKEKIKTETVIYKDGAYKTVQIVEYLDYKKISEKSEIKMPFKIKQIVGQIFFTLDIIEIDDKTRINNDVFEFSFPEPENEPAPEP